MSVSRTTSPLSSRTSVEATPRFVYASVIRYVGNSGALPTLSPQISPLLKQLKQPRSQIQASPLLALLASQQQMLLPRPRAISSSFQQPLSQKKLVPYGHLDKNSKEMIKKRAIELLSSKPKKTRLEVISNLRKEFKVEYNHANLRRCALKAGISFDDEITAKKMEKEEAKRKAFQYVEEKMPYRRVAEVIGVAPSTIANWMREQKCNDLPPSTMQKPLTYAPKISTSEEQSSNSDITTPSNTI